MGNGFTCSMNCDCSIAATLCTVVCMVCWSCVIVNTLHPGGSGGGDGDYDDDDDDDDDDYIASVV